MSRFKAHISGYILLLLLLSPMSHAHNRSQSFSVWSIDGPEVNAVFTVKAREVTRLLALEPQLLPTALTNHLQETIQVEGNSLPCPLQGRATSLPAAPGYLRASLNFRCEASLGNTEYQLQVGSFFTLAPSHVHYARFTTNSGAASEYLFTDAVRKQSLKPSDLAASKSVYHSVSQYAAIGVTHIFGGLDHIAFLIALLLLTRRPKDVLWLVSGFTLGHSISLSLAAMGWVTPDNRTVEALIGFSIALVAAENIGARTSTNGPIALLFSVGLLIMLTVSMLWGVGLAALTSAGLILFTLNYLHQSSEDRTARSLRPVLTLAFGLIHGFGFAQVLTETGLPSTALWPALLGFNLGVEIGQLVIVAVIGLVAYGVSRYMVDRHSMRVFDMASAILCGWGLYWFVARSYGAI